MYGRVVELALDSARIPFLSTDMPRMAALQAIPQNAAGGRLAGNVSPQILYAQNVLPTIDGYSSLRRTQKIAGAFGKAHLDAQEIIGPDNSKYCLAQTRTGAAIVRAGEPTWTYQDDIPGLLSNAEMFTCRVDGEQYVLFSNTGLYKVVTTPSLDFAGVTPVFTGAGIAITDVVSMSGANGYLVLATTDTIYWDAPQSRLIYTPAVGGPNSAKLSNLKGEIVALYQIANGFIVYATGNAISAQYSGNPNFPFVFREIPGSGGISYPYNVGQKTNLEYHLVWTNYGLQQISVARAENLFPEFTEFAQKGQIEKLVLTQPIVGEPLFLDGTWELNGDYLLNGLKVSRFDRSFPGYQLQKINYNIPHVVKPSIINNRYVALSYGPPRAVVMADQQEFLEAVIYDRDLQRWGKLVRPHTSLIGLSDEAQSLFVTYDMAELSGASYDDLASTSYDSYIQLIGLAAGGLQQFTSVNVLGEMQTYTRDELQDIDQLDMGLAPALLFGRISVFKQRPTLVHKFEVNEVNLLQKNSAFLFWGSMGNSSQSTFQTPVPRLPAVLPNEGTAPEIYVRGTYTQFGFGLIASFELKTVLVRCQESGER